MFARKVTRAFLMSLLGATVLQADLVIGQDPGVDAIRGFYERTTSRIHSLECVFTVRYSHMTESSTPLSRYIRQGEKYYLCDNIDAKPFPKAWVWNGKYFINYDQREGVAPNERQVQIQRQVPDMFQHNPHPGQLVGFSLSQVNQSLAQLLEHPEIRYDGKETLLDAECWRFVIDGLVIRTGTACLFKVWFDPDHDFLPRKISYQSKSSSWVHEWTIDEFRSVEDGASNDKLWFPSQATLFQGEGFLSAELKVRELTINGKIDAEVFDPHVEPGTNILDIDQNRHFLTGGEEAVQKRITELADEARGQIGGPRVRTLWIWIIVGVAAVMAGIMLFREK